MILVIYDDKNIEQILTCFQLMTMYQIKYGNDYDNNFIGISNRTIHKHLDRSMITNITNIIILGKMPLLDQLNKFQSHSTITVITENMTQFESEYLFNTKNENKYVYNNPDIDLDNEIFVYDFNSIKRKNNRVQLNSFIVSLKILEPIVTHIKKLNEDINTNRNFFTLRFKHNTIEQLINSYLQSYKNSIVHKHPYNLLFLYKLSFLIGLEVINSKCNDIINYIDSFESSLLGDSYKLNKFQYNMEKDFTTILIPDNNNTELYRIKYNYTVPYEEMFNVLMNMFFIDNQLLKKILNNKYNINYQIIFETRNGEILVIDDIFNLTSPDLDLLDKVEIITQFNINLNPKNFKSFEEIFNYQVIPDELFWK